MQQISKTNPRFDLITDVDSLDDLNLINVDLVTNASVGDTIYAVVESGPNGVTLQLFRNMHEAANDFNGIHLLWGYDGEDQARIAASFTAQAKAFLADPANVRGNHYEHVGWGGDADVSVFAAEVIA